MNHPKYRPDIDGLRAVAVLAVVIFHVFPDLLPGGFIGVDVFFVISGYLISSIILSSLEQSSFSFREFYARRIKRIFPALILVLTTCLVLGGFVLLTDEYRQLGKHTAGGAAFVSNFVLWNEVGYFDNAAESKPLLHLWSLGIEEQYYIIWPLLLFLCWRARIGLFWPIIVLALASFVVNVATVGSSPDAAFYSPISRFWELMAGSYLAYLKLHPPHLRGSGHGLASIVARLVQGVEGGAYADFSSVLGIGLLVAGILAMNAQMPFPGWWALLPILASLLIIAAGQEAWANRRFLSMRGMVLVGLISYPLYLWHWPLLFFARLFDGEQPSLMARVFVVGIGLMLAWLTYRFVEIPVRFQARKRNVTVILAVVMLVVGAWGYKIDRSDGLKYRLNNIGHAEDQFVSPKKQLKRERDFCQKLHPEFSSVCFMTNSAGTGKENEVVFVGDSHSEILSAGFIDAFPDMAVSSFGLFGCPPFLGVERYVDEKPLGCPAVMESAYRYVGQRKGATVIITARMAWYISGKGFGKAENRKNTQSHIQLVSDVPHPESGPAGILTLSMRRTLERLLAEGVKVIFVQQVPELGFSPKTCVNRPFRKMDASFCRVNRVDVMKRQEKYREMVSSVLAEFPQVSVFDPMDYLCDDKYCYLRDGDSILYRDDDHLSMFGSRKLSRELIKRIRAIH